MKKFLIWLPLVLLVYGILFLSTHNHLIKNPKKIMIIVDTSFEMKKYSSLIKKELSGIFSKRYSEFSLATDKAIIFDWKQGPLSSYTLKFYGPVNFNNINTANISQKIEEADRVILISNSEDAKTILNNYKRVEIRRL